MESLREAAMNSGDELRVAFIPFSAPGHMIPLMEIARIFARHGVNVTFITTTGNAARFHRDVDSDSNSGYKIKLHALQLPFDVVGLPPGLESFSDITSMEMAGKLGRALALLESLIEEFLLESGVDCIVSDTILGWTADAATRLEIPRLAFECAGYIAMSITECIISLAPHSKVKSDLEPFELPGLPHKIELTKSQMPDWVNTTNKRVAEMIEKTMAAQRRSLGILMNSFLELEADYKDYFEAVSGLRTWTIGPVSSWLKKDNVDEDDGGSSSEVMDWLDLQELNSILYIGFGSMTMFPDEQLLEIAHALEDSAHRFIWVVRKRGDYEDRGKKYCLESFEERMKKEKKGLIIRKWAPQIKILNHPAVGGFVTQCGWNSVLESICTGQPVISWPLTAEQFYIEKLMTQVTRTAVPVGARRWWDMNKPEALEIVKREQITKVITLVMGVGDEAEGMRERARELGRAAETATSIGGSSYKSLVALMDELKSIKLKKNCKSD